MGPSLDAEMRCAGSVVKAEFTAGIALVPVLDMRYNFIKN
jgi:hypothetical protein